MLEGNRRLSALRVLSNPDILAGTDLTEATKRLLVREASGFERSKVEPIRCVRFDDREDANDWIRRRHTGEAGGEGRITWKPLEIQRFSGDYTTIDVIDFVGRNAGYSKEEWAQAQSALGGGKSTNLTRLLESAAGQSHLGIKMEMEPSRKTPLLAVDPKWALEVLKRIVDDILKGDVNSRRLNRALDIEKYFANLPPELQPGPDTTVTAPKAFRDISLAGSRAKPPQKQPVRTKPRATGAKDAGAEETPVRHEHVDEARDVGQGGGHTGCRQVPAFVCLRPAGDRRAGGERLPEGERAAAGAARGPGIRPDQEGELRRRGPQVEWQGAAAGPARIPKQPAHQDVGLFDPVLERVRAQPLQPADRRRPAGRVGGSGPGADRGVWRDVMPEDGHGIGPTGRYSPLRYPGGKGKLSKFMAAIVRANGLSDGRYIEPYAGGAGIAWELLITGVVRHVLINDISPHVFAFWTSVLSHTDELCRRIRDVPLSVEEWDRQKEIFRRPEDASTIELGVSCFYLNRTNRSGILNGGLIGGRNQEGKWRMDARFNRGDLVRRITKIADCRRRIEVSCTDAVELMREKSGGFGEKDLIYVDPPYFEKGRLLYYDAYGPDDHASVAELLSGLEGPRWVVSYDDVDVIRSLYEFAPRLQYTIGYSARQRTRGREVMFFSKGMAVPELVPPLREANGGGAGNPVAAA